MKFQIEATPDELVEKSHDLVLRLARKLSKADGRLTAAVDVLEKGLARTPIAAGGKLPKTATRYSALTGCYTCWNCAHRANTRCHVVQDTVSESGHCASWLQMTGSSKVAEGYTERLGENFACGSCRYFLNNQCVQIRGAVRALGHCSAWASGQGRMPRRAKRRQHAIAKRYTFAGLPIAVENPQGSVREWRDAASGAEGRTLMFVDYGYVEGVKGADGDEYDVFIGPDESAPLVFVVHQRRPDTGELYDEDKALIGFPDVHTAIETFLMHYDDPDFLGSLSVVPIEEFRQRIGSDGVLKSVKPANGARPEFVISDAALAKGSLDPKLAADNSARGLGNRGVDAGSGVNIAVGSPQPSPVRDSALAEMLRDGIEEAAEASFAGRGLAIRRDPKIYNPGGHLDVPARPVSAVVGAGERARGDAEANYEWQEAQAARRMTTRQTPERLLPRDPRDHFYVSALGPDSTDPARPVEKAITVKKRGLGTVHLTVRGETDFEVQLPGRDPRSFTSLSQACDHVWCVQKGYDDVDSWRQATGKWKVPSGAGWRFWGVKVADALSSMS